MSGDSGAKPTTEEKIFTVAELAVILRLSRDTIIRKFEKEAGVLVFEGAPRPGRRRYRTLRIPAPVVERVCRRLSVVR